MSFEQALTRLEAIISAIESHDATLEESVKLYKEGMELSLFCSKSLQAAEQEITQLQQTANGGYSKQPFDMGDME